MNDVQKAAEEAMLNGHPRRPSKVVGAKSRTGSSRSNISRMISVDDLPISGKAMPLGKRPSTNKSAISTIDLNSDSSSRTSSKVNIREEARPNYSRSVSGGGLQNQNNFFKEISEAKKAVSEVKLDRQMDDVTPPRSPLVVQSTKHLLLRPADNSPFSSATAFKGQQLVNGSSNHGGSSANSTPYSQISVPSSYDYEDDFTSESESEMCLLPSSNNPGASSDNRYTIFAKKTVMLGKEAKQSTTYLHVFQGQNLQSGSMCNFLYLAPVRSAQQGLRQQVNGLGQIFAE